MYRNGTCKQILDLQEIRNPSIDFKCTALSPAGGPQNVVFQANDWRQVVGGANSDGTLSQTSDALVVLTSNKGVSLSLDHADVYLKDQLNTIRPKVFQVCCLQVDLVLSRRLPAFCTLCNTRM